MGKEHVPQVPKEQVELGLGTWPRGGRPDQDEPSRTSEDDLSSPGRKSAVTGEWTMLRGNGM